MVSLHENQIRRTLDILANEGPKKGWSVFEERQVRILVNRRSTLSWSRSYKKHGQWFWNTGCRCRITRICFFLLAETCSKGMSLLENLSYLDDPRCALGILRYCLGTPNLVYSLRTNTTTREKIDVLKVFDSSQRYALDQIIGTDPTPVTMHGSSQPCR